MGRYGWRNEDGVRGTRGRTIRLDASCTNCDWQRKATAPGELAGNAVRVAARRHASIEKHVVALVHTTQRYFEPDPDLPAGTLSQRQARQRPQMGAPR